MKLNKCTIDINCWANAWYLYESLVVCPTSNSLPIKDQLNRISEIIAVKSVVLRLFWAATHFRKW
ncbi:hypothetical protein T08_13650 [Trichinella sp. T8]|nr:hypothetical protein T08_13650 [Trichinella sp. T8]